MHLTFLPVVLSRQELAAILKQLTSTERLVVMLLYGSGLRLEECLTLRVKDINFERHADDDDVSARHESRGTGREESYGSAVAWMRAGLARIQRSTDGAT